MLGLEDISMLSGMIIDYNRSLESDKQVVEFSSDESLYKLVNIIFMSGVKFIVAIAKDTEITLLNFKKWLLRLLTIESYHSMYKTDIVFVRECIKLENINSLTLDGISELTCILQKKNKLM